MNILNKAALKSLKNNRTRTLVTIIGVVLSAAMITAVAVFVVSLQSYMINGAAEKYGGWAVEFLDVPQSFIEEQQQNPEVSGTASVENIGYALLPGSQNPDKPYVYLEGFSSGAFDTVPLTLTSGRIPENSSEILIPSHVAANGGVSCSIGDTITLDIGRRVSGEKTLGQDTPYSGDSEQFKPESQKICRVVGFYERPSFEESTAPGYTVITAADAQSPQSWSVFVTLRDLKSVQSYVKEAGGAYASILNNNVLRFTGVSGDIWMNTLLYTAGGILTILIMTGSVFLIYNSFNISLSERMRQFGILSSVGATAGQLRRSVLFEGLCIGAVGIPIGIAAGLGAIQLVISVVAKNFSDFAYSSVPLTMTVTAPAIIVAAVVSLITILISAYIPARKAASIPVIECIRQTGEVKIDSKAVKVSDLSQRLFGLEGTLALKNFKRNKKRYRSVVLSLTFSVVLLITASSFSADLEQAGQNSIVDSDFDLCFYSQDIGESEMFSLYDRFRSVSGVTESSYQAVADYSCSVNTSELSPAWEEISGDEAAAGQAVDLSLQIQFVEDSVYRNFIKSLGFSESEYSGQKNHMVAAAKVKVDRDGKSELADLFAEPSAVLAIAPSAGGSEESVDVTFVDTIPVDTPPVEAVSGQDYTLIVIAPYSMRSQFDTSGAVTALTFRSNTPSESAAEMESIAQDAGIPQPYKLDNLAEVFEENRNISFVISLFSTVFVTMMTLIGMANVFNTISTNIMLRKRELAMLRSVGMSRRDFNRMMCYECAFYGFRTLLFGLPVSALLSWLVYLGMNAGGADISFVFPWAAFAVSIIGVFVVVFISMMYVVRKISRENIIDAMRDEMT